MILTRIMISLCAAMVAMGADAVVAGPVSGVVFDSRSHSIRVVNGVPGASLLGDTLADQLDAAEIAPNGKAALVSKGGQLYGVADLRGSTWTPLFAAQGIDRIAWNSNSTAAAVYSAAARNVVLITNVSSQLNFSVDSLAGDLTALAVDRSGSSIVVAVAGGVYLLTSQGPPALLAAADQPNGLSLIHQDQDLLVADAATQRIFEIRDYQNAAETVPFADATTPVAVAASSDARFVFSADKTCKCVDVYEFATRLLTAQIPLDTDPAFLKPVANGRQFLLNAPADGSTTFWILDTGDNPSAYFVSGGM